MPIEGISSIVRMPRLGHIRLGIKVEKPGKHPYPQATDYFVVPDEVAAVFGEKPKELAIMFPTENEADFAQQWLRCYSLSQGLVCIGDGVTSRRKFDLKTGAIAGRDTKDWEWREGLTCNPQECLEYLSKRCRRVMNLQVLIPKVPGLGVWQIDTSSFYSIVNINSMVRLLKNLAGRCSFIPLKLCLGPIEVTPPGQTKKTVHIMHIKQDMTLAEIARLGQTPAPQALLPEPEAEQPPEDLFPEEVLAEAEEVDGQILPSVAKPPTDEMEGVEQALDQEVEGRPAEKTVVKRDPSTIKTRAQFERACFEDFGLQPKEVWRRTGCTPLQVTNWGDLYLQVKNKKS
jgi:hypothetical protein